MKKIVVFLAVLIILASGILIFKDLVIKNSIEGFVSVATGLKMRVGELKTSVPKTFVSIKDMVILNPSSFNDRIMLDMPEIYIDFDLPSLFKGDMHLYTMRINLKELTVVKDRDGKTNLDYLKALKKEKEAAGQKDSSRKTNFLIDDLNLKIGKVTYKDYSGGGKPQLSEYAINIDATYKGVRDTKEIVRLIIAKALLNTAIGSLTDFERFRDIGSGTLEGGRDVLKKTVEGSKDALKKTVGGLKDIFQNPLKEDQ